MILSWKSMVYTGGSKLEKLLVHTSFEQPEPFGRKGLWSLIKKPKHRNIKLKHRMKERERAGKGRMPGNWSRCRPQVLRNQT